MRFIALYRCIPLSSLETFIPHAFQCGLDLDLARLYQRMGLSSLPQDSQTQTAHPALANAIYLLATHFSSSASSSHQSQTHATVADPTLQEQHFLTLALRGIAAALEEGESANDPAAGSDLAPPYALAGKDRGSPLVDAVQASVLLAIYFYGKARLLEGYYHSSAATRLAVALGMHQIESTALSASRSTHASPHMGSTDIALPESTNSPSASPVASGTAGASSWGASPTPSASLPPPRDSIELAERVSTFWSVFCVDRCWSVATGLPSSLPDDSHPQLKISTIWPCDIGKNVSFKKTKLTSGAKIQNLNVFNQNRNTDDSVLGSLYGAPNFYQTPSLALPTKALKSKASAFFERAARIASSA